jgi:threonylcarbamoyladenosine tRNA methylthiotransferase MtaB
LSSPFTFSVATMGCKANLTDSQDLEARLRDLGGQCVDQNLEPDIFVLNTCTVTDQADREAMQIIRKTKAPMVIATGCLAEVDPAKLQRTNGPMTVMRNSAKSDIGSVVATWLKDKSAKEVLQGNRVAWHKNVDHVSESALGAQNQARTRAFLKVQDGCNAYCAYCIIPTARGRSRSVASQNIVNEINLLAERGVNEVVLTAIHAADYDDDGLDFTGLVGKVLRDTKIARIRLTSLDPAEIPDSLLDLMQKNPRLCAHFHVSLQAASTKVLQTMKRAYSATEAEICLQKIFQVLPHAFVGMDIIAGFPGESEADFNDTFWFLERTAWSRLHVFPFSIRRGTAAEKMTQAGLAVAPSVIKDRAARLRALSELRFAQMQKNRIGKVVEVLLENTPYMRDGVSFSVGHTRNYFKVAIPGVLPGNRFMRVQIESVLTKELLLGQVV